MRERVRDLMWGIGSSLAASIIYGVVRDWLLPQSVEVLLWTSAKAFPYAFVAFVAYFYLRRWTGSLRGEEAIVGSVLVIDNDEVMLEEESAKNRRPWLVPPCAHVSKGVETPDAAVVKLVKDKADIDLEIRDVAPIRVTDNRTTTQLPAPFFVQREDQPWWEGHHCHHNFYYLGSIIPNRISRDRRHKYVWVQLANVADAHIPPEIIQVIGEVVKQRKSATHSASTPAA